MRLVVDKVTKNFGGLRAVGDVSFTVAEKSVYDVGQMHFDELHAFLGRVKPAGRGADAGRQVLREIRNRVELLLAAKTPQRIAAGDLGETIRRIEAALRCG